MICGLRVLSLAISPINPKYFSVHSFEGFVTPFLLNSMFYYIPAIDVVVFPDTLGLVAWRFDSYTYLGVKCPSISSDPNFSDLHFSSLWFTILFIAVVSFDLLRK